MNVPFSEHNISHDLQARQLFLEKGYDLLPMLEIGDNTVLQYESEAQLIEALALEGYI